VLRDLIEVVGMDGRNALGQFVSGCKPGPGNPHSAAVARNRAVLLEAVSVEELREVVRGLLEQALSGDIAAARLVLERCCGRPEPSTTAAPVVAVQNIVGGQGEGAGRVLARDIAARIRAERAAVLEHRPGEPG
jgi:hypothetical protein